MINTHNTTIIDLLKDIDNIFNFPNSFIKRNANYLKENTQYILESVDNTHFKYETKDDTIEFNIVKPWSVKEDFKITLEKDILKLEYKANPSVNHYIKLFQYKIDNINTNKTIIAKHFGSQLTIIVPINKENPNNIDISSKDIIIT